MELAMNKKGFTLIELIVAIGVFSLIVLAMVTISFSVIQSQRKAFALQVTQEASRYILESMGKEVRTSKINSPDSPTIQVTVLDITNARGENVVYQFMNNRVYRQGEPLSPTNLEVNGGFYISKRTLPVRARITTVMQVKTAGAKVEEQAEIYLQNTIAPR